MYKPKANYNFLGIDPGTTHLGLAWNGQRDGQVEVMQVEMERSRNPVERMRNLGAVLAQTNNAILQPFRTCYLTCIEGAGYGSSQYRQVELAEVRTSVVWWIWSQEMGGVCIAAPNAIRKTVFGDGRIKAHDYWEVDGIPDFPKDALAALSCLCYASQQVET